MVLFKRSPVYAGIATFCFLSLVVAWLAETYFDIKPCSLCLYVRYVIVALLAVSLILCVFDNKWLKALNILFVTAAFSLSFYHMGVEQRWWQGPAFCTGAVSDLNKLKDLSADEKLEQLRNQLLSKRVVRCDQINWRIFGISATIWNTLFLAILLLVLGRFEWMKKTFIK